VTGLMVFVMNTRDFFGLPDTAYAGLGFWAAIAGSVQCIWMLAAVSYLPARERLPLVVPDRAITIRSRVARVES
jgi:hypothetical protein